MSSNISYEGGLLPHKKRFILLWEQIELRSFQPGVQAQVAAELEEASRTEKIEIGVKSLLHDHPLRFLVERDLVTYKTAIPEAF